VTAMVTPFDASGALDITAARALARRLVDLGNDGILVAGSTGEGMTLDARERSALVEAVKDEIGDRAAVWANVGTNDTRGSVAAVREAQAAGADVALAVVPYYNKPPQSGMLAHFGAIAEATHLPVVVYNIPGRTAANMLPETLLALAARYENIAGVKESSGDLKQIGLILRDRPAHFRVYAGDDHLFLPSLAMGADGVVGVASHLCAPQYRRMVDAYRAGRVDEAARIHADLLPLIDALFAVTNPIGIKFAMRELGFAVGECRLPLDAMPQQAAARLRPLLEPYRQVLAAG